MAVDQYGKLQLADHTTVPPEGGDDGSDVFKRNPTDPDDSYFARPDGEASTVSKTNFLRVGATNRNVNEAAQPDTAMVVAGLIESRGGNYIRKLNDTTPSNAGDNLKVNFVTMNSYTSLLNTVDMGKINFKSKNWSGMKNNDTSFAFTAEGANTQVGINTDEPDATLMVQGDTRIANNLTVGKQLTVCPTS